MTKETNLLRQVVREALTSEQTLRQEFPEAFTAEKQLASFKAATSPDKEWVFSVRTRSGKRFLYARLGDFSFGWSGSAWGPTTRL